MTLVVRPFNPADRAVVIALWGRCGLTRPWNSPERDIDRKLGVQADLFLVAEQDGVVVGSAMAGFDGHRGWVNYLAVEPERQGQGIGRRLMEQVEAGLSALGCPKLNLQVRAGNEAALAFYASLGYQVDEVVSLGKRLIADEEPRPCGC